MTVMDLAPSFEDEALTADVLTHLDTQLAAARRLLEAVLAQGAAIRAREVHRVVACTSTVQAEIERRGTIDRDRSVLLARAGRRLGVGPESVSVSRLAATMGPDAARAALSNSAELRGLLSEIEREHHVNRVLMSQELAFLDHLLGLVDAEHRPGYGATATRSWVGGRRPAARHRVLDLEV